MIVDRPDDLRGAPKGEARRWEIKPLMPKPGYTRRVRKHYEITYCADGFWSSGGSADHPTSDDEFCRTGFDAIYMAGKPHPGPGGYERLHPDPCLWRVDDRSRKRHWTRSYYCDAHFPVELRALLPEEERS